MPEPEEELRRNWNSTLQAARARDRKRRIEDLAERVLLSAVQGQARQLELTNPKITTTTLVAHCVMMAAAMVDAVEDPEGEKMEKTR